MIETISPDLKSVLKRLKLGPLLDVLPERLTLARQQKTPHQDFLLMLLTDEVSRRDGLATQLRAQRARLDPDHQLEGWDPTTSVRFDQDLWAELCTLRFIEAAAHVAIVGPVGVGKTFLAHALGNIACRRQHTVLAQRADHLLKTLKHARLDNTYEAELRRLLAVDLLIIDDFGLDAMDRRGLGRGRALLERLADEGRYASAFDRRGPGSTTIRCACASTRRTTLGCTPSCRAIVPTGQRSAGWSRTCRR